VTLPALPFVALSGAANADGLRRFGKGIEHAPHLHLGPLMLQLDADVGVALVRPAGADGSQVYALLRTGISLEVPDRWRFFVARATVLARPGRAASRASWLAALSAGFEHAF
jgi:hypothetical protein